MIHSEKVFLSAVHLSQQGSSIEDECGTRTSMRLAPRRQSFARPKSDRAIQSEASEK